MCSIVLLCCVSVLISNAVLFYNRLQTKLATTDFFRLLGLLQKLGSAVLSVGTWRIHRGTGNVNLTIISLLPWLRMTFFFERKSRLIGW